MSDPVTAAPVVAPVETPAIVSATPPTTTAPVVATPDPATPAVVAPAADPAAAVYELKAPEGVTLDKAASDALVAFAKEHKLPVAEAQKLADIAVEMQQRQVEQWAAQSEAWFAELKADKTLGGDKLDASKATANKAFTLAPQGTAELLKEFGLANHPLLFKWCHAVGSKLSEDSFVPGGAVPNTAGRAQGMFDNSKMNA